MDHFKQSCTVNSTDSDLHFRKLYMEKVNLYLSQESGAKNINRISIDSELIGFCIDKLHVGKSPGLDKLQAEHLLYAHPVLYVILARLFKFMITNGCVPSAFGAGLLIPIPKDSARKGILSVDQFRGITISPIISKVFEHCLMHIYSRYLVSSDRQFGFKKKISCQHGIFSVRKVIDFFVADNSTVNLCCLDISKAFDRVNHHALFLKLIDRGAPMNFIFVLHNWYSNSYCSVKWGGAISDSFQLSAGVRQGGVLSPILFSVFVNEILVKLDSRGCRVLGLSMGSFMYADDLVLLSSSVTELQDMVNICCEELRTIDLKLNESKSVCIRVGKRFNVACPPITTPTGVIAWSTAATYLGVDIVSAKAFTCCISRSKSKFYASFNAIYGKLGKVNNAIVTLNLIAAMALPVILYASEALRSRRLLLRLENIRGVESS